MKQFAVLGLGRFGSSVAETLYELGHEVVVVDFDEENINNFDEKSTHGIIGDTTHEDVLRAAGVREVDTVIIAITDFQTSVMTALLCKELGAKKIIAKARNDKHAKILEQIGVDKVVVPEKDMGRKLAHNLSSRNVIDIITLSSNYEIIEIKAPQSWIGSTIAQVDVRKRFGLNILGINRGELEFIGNPQPSVDIKKNDSLIVLGSTSDLAKLEEIE